MVCPPPKIAAYFRKHVDFVPASKNPRGLSRKIIYVLVHCTQPSHSPSVSMHGPSLLPVCHHSNCRATHPPHLPLHPNIHEAARAERTWCAVLRGKYGGRGSWGGMEKPDQGPCPPSGGSTEVPSRGQCHIDTVFLGTGNHLSFMDRILKSTFARI